MLETHTCSNLLLPESQSDAWVAQSITEDVIGEKFVSRQFECDLKWRQHITPHWRLKGLHLVQ